MFGFGKKTPQEEFWRWFLKNEELLFEFERDQERIFGLLNTALNKVHEGLTFEFGPRGSVREFVISADGIKSRFPAVVALAQAAPPLSRWKVIAFRPRRPPVHSIRIDEVLVDPADVSFALLDDGTIAGIYLFIPGVKPDDARYKQIGYLLLDEALGEFDVETRLGLIEMLAPRDSVAIEADRYPLSELPHLFDGLVARLEGRSGKPS
jgi:hypothetical protein